MAVASFQEAAESTWSHVVERARRELPESSFSMWFQGVRATSLHDGILEVLAPSEYVKDRLAKNYGDLILEAATEALGLPVEIQFDAAEIETVAAQPETEVPPPERSIPRPGTLGAPGLPFPNYTFDDIRPRPVQPIRARRGDGRRRGAAVQGVQPAVHLRRRRPGQDPPPRRDRPPHASPARRAFA